MMQTSATGVQLRTIDLTYLANLYTKYRTDLARVRRYQKVLHQYVFRIPNPEAFESTEVRKIAEEVVFCFGDRSKRTAQFDDVNAEITYLLLREERPLNVVELSPSSGWSTTWILNALRDNGTGVLHSYDIDNFCVGSVPKDLSQGIWHFIEGRIQDNLDQLPAKIDYLFIDSDHSREFALWYLEHIFPRVAPGTVTSVDDVFHWDGPEQSGGEGTEVLNWLQARGVEPFDCARSHGANHLIALLILKQQLGLVEPVNPSDLNTCIFFRMPRS